MFVKVVTLLLAVFLAVESQMLVGAPVDADKNNPEVQAALQFAVARYNAQSNSVYTSQVQVIKVQTQVIYLIDSLYFSMLVENVRKYTISFNHTNHPSCVCARACSPPQYV